MKFVKSVGEEYQVVKRGRENHGCREKCNVGKGKQYHLPFDIEAVEKHIKWGKETEFLGMKNQDFKKMRVRKKIKL